MKVGTPSRKHGCCMPSYTCVRKVATTVLCMEPPRKNAVGNSYNFGILSTMVCLWTFKDGMYFLYNVFLL